MNPLLWGAVGLSVAFQASVVGTVRDAQNHAPLAGAVVVLNDEFRSVVADTGGRYVLENVPAGPQHLTVRHFRYRPRSLHALVPADGKLVVHVVLEPEPVPLDLYEVRAGVPVRDLERVDASGQPDRECSIAALRNHPLLAEPDVFEALGGGDVALRPELPGGAHVRGGASDQTAYALDGIPVFNPFHAAGLAGAWSPDALSRVTLTGSTPAPGSPNALSGTIEGTTRAAGARLGAQGSFTTTHSSFTFDGPLPLARTGYVVSLRSGYPGIFAPRDEPSHVMGETGDRLAKLETPAFGGTIRLLAYDSENEIDTSADRAAVDEPDPVAGRNLYAWSGQSLGAGWERELPGWTVRLLGFGAAAGASAHWRGPDGPSAVTADRRDAGFVAMAARTTGGTTTTFGLRADRSTTSYRVESDSSGLVEWALEARTPVVTAFGDHELPLGARTALALGASLAANRGDLHPAPRARVRFRPANAWTLSMSLARSHQFVQSLRNPESVVGNVFPAELFIGAGAPGVPVAHSDHAILAAEWRPTARLRLGSRAYVRDFDGLVLVAPSASG
ncbi:MAG: carboxypeptidase regulatory-like domain-containing protein, partial [Candidatus Eiseniibacteriota bacterium]